MMMLTLTTAMMLTGTAPDGRPCHLEIQSVEAGAMTVRSDRQRPANPAIRVSQSQTPWAYYGRDEKTRDQIAVMFRPAELTPENIQSVIFQGLDESGNRVQAYCRFL